MGSQRKKKRRRNSALKDHRRNRKTLTPPLLSVGPIQFVEWGRDWVPNMLLLAAAAESAGNKADLHDLLDVLDRFVPNGEFIDGTITSLATVPEPERAAARFAVFDEEPWALPDGFCHALALYPECPAAWLIEDWRRTCSVDPEEGLRFMKGLVVRLLPSKEIHPTRLRMVVLSRMMKHGKLVMHSGLPTLELLPKYPGGLTEDECSQVESWTRATWNGVCQTGDIDAAQSWAAYFWRQGWEISACEPRPKTDRSSALDAEPERGSEPDPSGGGRESTGEAAPAAPTPTLGIVAPAVTEAIRTLGSGLECLQARARVDLYEPVADEVRIGLASRQYRVLRLIGQGTDLWSEEVAPHLLRSLVDTRITLAWLLAKDDTGLYRAFRDYGMGKRKLFKLKLEELIDREDGVDDTLLRVHAMVESEVNAEIMEEFQEINLGGNFAGRSIREMAADLGLEDLYSLTYQPLSTEAHGEWGSLIAYDLVYCGNALHRFHRMGAFERPATVSRQLAWVMRALELARDSICPVFSLYGLNAEDLFDQCLGEIAAGIAGGGSD